MTPPIDHRAFFFPAATTSSEPQPGKYSANTETLTEASLLSTLDAYASPVYVALSRSMFSDGFIYSKIASAHLVNHGMFYFLVLYNII